MLAILSFLIVLFSSVIIVQIGAVLLQLTGLSYDVAKFQAQSAFTGTGFSTTESEMIVSHPLRRRIVGILMIAGPIGFISFSSSLILSFLHQGETDLPLAAKIAVLVGGILFIYLLFASKWFNRLLVRFIKKMTKKIPALKLNDYDSLLNISGEYTVSQCRVQPDSWIEGRSLEQLQLNNEGILVLGIRPREGRFAGTPQKETLLSEGDEVIFYGKEAAVRALIDRKKGSQGDLEHLNFLSAHKNTVKSPHSHSSRS